jgi:PKD repeat protein
LIFEENSEGNAYMPSGISNSEGFYLQTVAHHILTDVDSVKTDFTKPDASFAYNVNALEVSFINNSNRSTNWLWEFGDGNSDNVENPVHVYASTGVYDVNLTSNNYCISDDTTITITLSSASLDQQAIDEFKVFPNPSSGEVNINYFGTEETGYVLNALGQELERFELINPVINLSTGLYYIRIGDRTRRIIIQ